MSKAFALAGPRDPAPEIRDEVGFFQEVWAMLAKSLGGRDGKKSHEKLEAVVPVGFGTGFEWMGAGG